MTSDGDFKTESTAAEDSKSPTNAEIGSPFDHSGDEPQPERVQASFPTNNPEDSPASGPNATNTTPEAPADTTPRPSPARLGAPPRPRSWFASLSRRGSSNVPLNELAEHTPPLMLLRSEKPPEAQPTVSLTTAAATPLPEEPPETVPTNLPILEPQPADAGRSEVDTKLVPRKRAWFAASSSPKRPSKLRPGDEPPPPVDAARDPPVPETPQLLVTNIIPPTPPRTDLGRVECEPPSDTVPVPIPAARKWFSSALSSQSRPSESEARPVSPLADPQAAFGSPSSIDDQVPNLPSTGKSSEPPVMLSTDTNQNLSSLNPSASRFSFGIPFLGRPQVPLDSPIASPSASGTRTEPDIPPISSKDSPAVEPTLETPEKASVLPSGLNFEPADSDTLTTQGSWWGVIGWQSATSHTPSQAQNLLPIRPSEAESAAIATETDPSDGDVPNSNSPAPLEARHGSTLSAETPQEDRGSSWLALWSWYGQSSSPLAPGMDQTKEGSANAETETPKMADAEAKVVEEAPLQQESTSSANIEPTNPIQSSITANISGWTSFFSSRSLLAKRIEESGHREEDTMEVMDIDEGDDERGSSVALAMTSEARARKDPVSREMQVSKQSPAPPRSPSPSPKLKTKPDDLKGANRTSVSPTPSKGSGRASPRVPPPPNLILPTWDDTFLIPPRSTVPCVPTDSALAKTVRFVSGMLFAKDDGANTEKGKARAKDDESFADFERELPRIWDVIGERLDGDILRGCKRVVVIGIHGWFPGAVMRTVLGEPTGTSNKFVMMMCQALEVFQEQHGVKIEKVTQIPLEGEGTISKRVEKLYANLTANSQWMDDLHAADAILVATHSQGSIVSTHLLDRLIREKRIKTSRTSDFLASASAVLTPGGTTSAAPPAQRVCCLALCGIHLGPLRYLSSSSLLQPYIQYFESSAAKELFEFQSTNSEVSKDYVRALHNVVDHGVKMVYVASLNDQVVPLYSGLFTAASHPLILRALYIDGDAYHSSDFLSNLLVLLLRVMNVGLSDSGLLTHLSEATAGSLNGIGHSKAYEELTTYSLAVNYLFMTNHGSNNKHPDLVVQPFNANTELNDYEIPWALRDLIANERVAHLFASDFANLRDAFPDWQPKTAILRDIKRKLQPIQRLNTNPSRPSKL